MKNARQHRHPGATVYDSYAAQVVPRFFTLVAIIKTAAIGVHLIYRSFILFRMRSILDLVDDSCNSGGPSPVSLNGPNVY